MDIKDAEWCGDMGPKGASCVHTLTDETRDIKPADWDAERKGMMCTKAENFANWKEAILKLCHETKSLCSFEEKQAVRKFADRVERQSRRAKKASGKGSR